MWRSKGEGGNGENVPHISRLTAGGVTRSDQEIGTNGAAGSGAWLGWIRLGK